MAHFLLIMVDFCRYLCYNLGAGKSEVMKMSPRTGRPKVDNAKTEKISICLDGETKKMIEDYSVEKKITRSEVVRRGVRLLVRKEKE